MKTSIHPAFKSKPEVQEAESILRACVHCGFCTATCPTYQLLGDERDGPRGRIYLIKQFLETGTISEASQTHLDRCLTCRSCETTCPSGVRYGRLIDIGRHMMDATLPRKPVDKFKRLALRKVLPKRYLFGALLKTGQLVRPVLPNTLRQKVPAQQARSPWPQQTHARKMIALQGCAQAYASPNTNAAAARVLDKLGISLFELPKAGCCGAVSYHLAAHDEGLDYMRRNIDAWWPALEAGAEAIVMTASGCGAMIKEYGELLAHDPDYASKAAKVSAVTFDIAEILGKEDLSPLRASIQTGGKVAVHCPCTLNHAQKLPNAVQSILRGLGFDLAKTQNDHLCCGSAGTYSILQSKISQQLLSNKLHDLSIEQPEQIVTANIGCQLHLGSQSKVPVRHWVELLDKELTKEHS